MRSHVVNAHERVGIAAASPCPDPYAATDKRLMRPQGAKEQCLRVMQTVGLNSLRIAAVDDALDQIAKRQNSTEQKACIRRGQRATDQAQHEKREQRALKLAFVASGTSGLRVGVAAPVCI